MKGVDTNVLVRLLVGDDAEQAARSRRYVEDNAPCLLNRIVLCETVWVLERFYGHSKHRIASALTQVVDTRQFEIEDLEAIQAGIDALTKGLDFADVVIAETNRRHGCTATATFDRRASKLDGFEPI